MITGDAHASHGQRVDAFIDAAFAFTVTLLVVANSDVPRSMGDMLNALRGVPAFAAAFAQIVYFWRAHLTWRRDYGVADVTAFWLSMLLVFLVLVFVYPLEMLFSSAFHALSGGWLPSGWVLGHDSDIKALFIAYGVVFALLSGSVVMLYLHSMRRIAGRVRDGAVVWAGAWSYSALIGLLVALVAWALPAHLSGLAGFCLGLLGLQGVVVGRIKRRIDTESHA
ncbi:TMEM175 family protein [Oleiagrimonas sp.]|uniref:TMEM175 family protein n=1 Tax=Oleiagrimonas sp. TaxID=2010330 RepID=UPI00262DF7F3|nr:TMEM175 family protein [Oleiagrimonas sp.]MDA3915308.1 TMEM175 family protein [Oleiagrimonas sp.]